MSNWTALNRARVRDGELGTTEEAGFNGFFVFRLPGGHRKIRVICSDGLGWKHVSVTLGQHTTETPTWEEMCAVKDLFFEPEDCVMQLHPPAEDYVNRHKGCLHLWMPLAPLPPIPRPPKFMVG